MNLCNVFSVRGRYGAIGILAAALLLSGCGEVHRAVDGLLGKYPSQYAVAAKAGPVMAKIAGQYQWGAVGQARDVSQKPPKRKEKVKKPTRLGKRRPPGKRSPATEVAQPKPKEKSFFVVDRDPFEKPREVLPTECPPSMPLCRFDRSQLKLVGVIQIADGQFKGMVQDPDGRGYFVTPGMQILGSTVTQVGFRGVTLRDHKTQREILMRLFAESREPGE